MNAQTAHQPAKLAQFTTCVETSSATSDGVRECIMALVLSLLLMSPIAGWGGREVYKSWRVLEDARLAVAEAAKAYDRMLSGPPLPVLAVNQAARGRDLFMATCVACHGQTGVGVVGLGKDLVTSTFVAWQSDEGLAQFLVTGRPNARPAAMPPKGGREDLTDSDLRDIVMYVRGLQDPRRMPELPAPAPVVIAPPTEAEKATALAAAGGDPELAQYIANGTKIFATTCIACHGPGGTGIKGNGKQLLKNDFIKSLDDDALLAFIKRGRDPSDPKNTTGIGMPAKGGNPALSDDDLLDVISYLRTLQGERPAVNASK